MRERAGLLEKKRRVGGLLVCGQNTAFRVRVSPDPFALLPGHPIRLSPVCFFYDFVFYVSVYLVSSRFFLSLISFNIFLVRKYKRKKGRKEENAIK